MKDLIPLLTATLGLITGSSGGNTRRNLRAAWRYYRKIRRQLKKGGLTEQEGKTLNQLLIQFIEAQKKLL